MPNVSSGAKTLVFNSRERALSGDFNRLQAFLQASVADAMKWLLQQASVEEDGDGGALSSFNPGNAPLAGTVLQGLLAVPGNATINMTVEPGSALILMPTGDQGPDDSQFALVDDPGVTSAAPLQLTANASGFERVDVVECQPVLVVQETASRDIYNTTTGVFSPATVTKAQRYQMSYRIRLGTPGAGYPAPAVGWLPLYVCSVPNGAATWNTVVIYDVRPLSSARRRLNLSSKNVPEWHSVDALVTSAGLGTYDFDVDFGAYSPGHCAFSYDHSVANNREPAWVAPVNTFFSIALAFPFGLPRWAKYTSTYPRVPGTSRGVPVATAQVPDRNGVLAGPVGLPVNSGLSGGGGSATNLLAVTTVLHATAINPWLPLLVRDKHVEYIYTFGLHVVAATASGAALDEYVFDPGLTGNVPGNAKSLILRIHNSWTTANTVTGRMRIVYDVLPDGAAYTPANSRPAEEHFCDDTAAGTDSFAIQFEIPLVPTGLTRLKLLHNTSAVAGHAITARELEVIGYRF